MSNTVWVWANTSTTPTRYISIEKIDKKYKIKAYYQNNIPIAAWITGDLEYIDRYTMLLYATGWILISYTKGVNNVSS